MAKAEIFSGICGFTTQVAAHKNETDQVTLSISSECKNIQRLAAVLKEVDPFREFTFRGAGPLTLQLAGKYCAHPGCPVPSGIVKAVEVEAGLALPADAHITISRDSVEVD